MRWKSERGKIYLDGDKREIKKFLLFPYRIGEEVRWLETVNIVQEYNYQPPFTYWSDLGFKDKEGQKFLTYKEVIAQSFNKEMGNPPKKP